MTPPEPAAAMVSRIELRARILALTATVAAALVPGPRALNAAAVGGGATLALVSFWAIRRGITGLADVVLAAAAPGAARAIRPRVLALFLLRYALLSLLAYVMIARLRLPPLGLLCGASVTMLAAAAELMRRPRPS